MDIRKILILGHSGFIGQAMVDDIRRNKPDVEVVGFSSPDVDFEARADWEVIRPHLGEGTAVVFLAAVKRQVGDTLESFSRNMNMIYHLAEVVGERPVGKLVFFSSGAVYGEDVQHSTMTEATPVTPTSYYGIYKYAAERILAKCVRPGALVCLRPPTAYGGGDLPQYGPSGFVHKSITGETITLWGDGEELREFIYIDDLVTVARDVLFGDFCGVLNVCAGVSYSFQDVLRAVALLPGGLPQIDYRERTKDKVDNHYDNTLLRQVVPDFRFTTLEEGVRKTYDSKIGAGA